MKKLILLTLLSFLLSVSYSQIIPGVIASSIQKGGYTVVDTLGYYGAAASTTTPTDLRATTTTCTATGYIDTIYVYMGLETNTDSVKLAIYDDNASYPGTLLGQTGAVVGFAGGYTDVPVPLLAHVHVTNTSVYWLAVRSLNVVIAYNAAGVRKAVAHTWGTVLPDPFTGGGSSGTATYRLWAKIKVE